MRKLHVLWIMASALALLSGAAKADSLLSDQPVIEVSSVTKAYNGANQSYVAFCVNQLRRNQDYFFYYYTENTYEEKRAREILALLIAARGDYVDVHYVVNGNGKNVITAINY